MGTIVNPVTIAMHFGIPEKELELAGVVNVLLNTDTLLFIDPMLLISSRHPEINHGAVESYNRRFELIIKLLSASKECDDFAWRSAEKLFKFSEINWTCLGYGSSNKGSGFGKDLTASTLDTASKIIELGVKDTDLFMALSLFEEGIGPDRISDMTTNIILNDLINFTKKANGKLNLPTRSFKVGADYCILPINPFSGNPLILVPRDIVRDLPLATDWSEIAHAVKENEELRERVNGTVGEIWATMTSKQKKQMKHAALRSRDTFGVVLEMIRTASAAPYDLNKDKNGEIFWTKLMKDISGKFPFDLSEYKGQITKKGQVVAVVERILKQFQDLVENKGLWKELWSDDFKPRREKAAQRLFFAVAHSYCKANDLDLTPEADSGNGPVDFKISHGFQKKVVVEIKLSTNPNVIHGYEKQLEIYKEAEDTDIGFYLLVDVGGLGEKYEEIQKIRSLFLAEHGIASSIFYVDAGRRESASKRK